jgi:nucleoside-diphosphate-sugar epimerase
MTDCRRVLVTGAILLRRCWRQGDRSYSLYNLTSAQPITPIDAAFAVQRALPVAQIVSDEMPVGPQKRFGHLNNERFVSQFGFRRWTPLSDGVAQTVEWLRATVESA